MAVQKFPCRSGSHEQCDATKGCQMNVAQLLSEGSTLLHCSGRLGASCIPISTHVPNMHIILCFWASTPSKTILTSSPPSTTPPIAALEYRSCGELCGEICPCSYQSIPLMLSPKCSVRPQRSRQPSCWRSRPKRRPLQTQPCVPARTSSSTLWYTAAL